MIKTLITPQTPFPDELFNQRKQQSGGMGCEGLGKDMGAAARVPNSALKQEYRKYNALGSRQALFIMGWTRVLEASGGSGPPKARVLWAPIGTGGVNRRAVSLRSLFAYEPRVVFRDNKRATSSSARNDDPTIPRSLFSSLALSFSLVLVLLTTALLFVSFAIISSLYPSNRFTILFSRAIRSIVFCCEKKKKHVE